MKFETKVGPRPLILLQSILFFYNFLKLGKYAKVGPKPLIRLQSVLFFSIPLLSLSLFHFMKFKTKIGQRPLIQLQSDSVLSNSSFLSPFYTKPKNSRESILPKNFLCVHDKWPTLSAKKRKNICLKKYKAR